MDDLERLYELGQRSGSLSERRRARVGGLTRDAAVFAMRPNAPVYFMMRARLLGLVIDSASLYSPGTSSSMVGSSSVPAVI